MSGTDIEIVATCKWLYINNGGIEDAIVCLKKVTNYYIWEYHMCNITRHKIVPTFKINRVLSTTDCSFKEGDLDELCYTPQ